MADTVEAFLFSGEGNQKTVQKPHCLVLRVKVLSGKNHLSFWDKLDVIHSHYIELKVPLSPHGTLKTKEIRASKENPVWNESFEILMNGKLKNTLSVTLKKTSLVGEDTTINEVPIDLNKLQQNENHDQSIAFNEDFTLSMRMRISESEKHEEIRYEVNICEEEREFVSKRKEHVFQAMQKLLGDKGPKTEDEIPTIGYLGSGGGLRATIALSGTTCALDEMGIFDCSMYFSALSGGAWYLSTLYSHPSWPKAKPAQVNNELRECLAKDWKRFIFNPFWLYRVVKHVEEKKQNGQPISLVDLFGYLLADMLIADRKDALLSKQTEKIQDGAVPLPMYAVLHVKAEESAKIFGEWMEMLPFETGILKYGSYLKSKKFGNKYFCGERLSEYPEVPLSYIKGICGSAFAILPLDYMKDPFGHKAIVNKQFDIHNDRAKLLDEVRKDIKPEIQMASATAEHSDEDDKEIDDLVIDLVNTLKHSKGELGGIQAKSDEDNENLAQEIAGYDNLLHERDEMSEEVAKYLEGMQLAFPKGELLVSKVGAERTIKSGVELIAKLIKKLKFMLKNREGRAAEVYNYFRGLEIEADQSDDQNSQPDAHKLLCESESMMIVDAGIQLISPFPLVLREQRHVDLILSFDYGDREKDNPTAEKLFAELIAAEKWAKVNKYPFPNINYDEQYKEYGIREYYVFKNDDDPKSFHW